jgi:hypothetical protein
MSTLRVNTIQNAAGSGDPTLNGTAKAWVNFNGTGTVSIRASFNVTSITDNGTGDYTVNFTNALADANYSICGTTGDTVANNVFIAGANAAPTTLAYRFNARTTSNTNADMPYLNAAFFR